MGRKRVNSRRPLATSQSEADIFSQYFGSHISEAHLPMDQPAFPRASFETGEPVHARAPEHDIDFFNLVGLILGGRQSPHMGDLDLVADLSLDAARFQIGDRRYELSLRQVRVLVEKENAEIEPQLHARRFCSAATSA